MIMHAASKTSKKKSFLREIYLKYEELIKYPFTFLFNAFVYGLLLNFTLFSIFGFTFNIGTTFAWGFAFYFIKDELPPLIARCFPIQKMQK